MDNSSLSYHDKTNIISTDKSIDVKRTPVL